MDAKSRAAVEEGYTRGTLLESLREGVAAAGLSPETVTIDDLSAADEFHIGGREASEHLLDQLGLEPGQHVLDVGCGVGGVSRVAASRHGVRVTGIDLTQEFVDAGNELTRWVGLQDRVELQCGNALELPYEDDSFDAAYVLHVGMNLDDKDAWFRGLHRVLKPGARLGVYDIMRLDESVEVGYPVPWALDSSVSFLATPAQYKQSLRDAGFEIEAEEDRTAFAVAFFANRPTGAPPPLGLHLVMGETGRERLGNAAAAVAAGGIGPSEIVAKA